MNKCNYCKYCDNEGLCTFNGDETCYGESYQQGRADAIDECIEEIYRISKSTTNQIRHYLYESIANKLERLKEQINE